jgi:[protein-PII] uridylyltransferase
MCRHHLLLPDVATRRDLDDPATVRAVADAVGSVEVLELLSALTEGDSIATGPAAWGSWKADLVRELVSRTAHVLGGGAPEDVTAAFPSDEQREMLAAGEHVLRGTGDTLVVVTPDRHGLFSRVAGVLALNGLDVLSADVATVDGMALEVFRVESSFGPTFSWERVLEDLDRALNGRLAIHARIAERTRVYGARGQVQGPQPEPEISFDNGASDDATVVEVHAPDQIGVLYRITRALAELDLDIVSAKVQTLGPQVVDSFYVRDPDGRKIDDPALLVEIERALLHGLVAD